MKKIIDIKQVSVNSVGEINEFIEKGYELHSFTEDIAFEIGVASRTFAIMSSMNDQTLYYALFAIYHMIFLLRISVVKNKEGRASAKVNARIVISKIVGRVRYEKS